MNNVNYLDSEFQNTLPRIQGALITETVNFSEYQEQSIENAINT